MKKFDDFDKEMEENMSEPILLLLSGPNLNLLGEREKSKYGEVTLEDVKKNCESHAKSINIE